MRTSAFALAGLLVLLPRAARAADWYVDGAVAPAGDGSKAKPFQTINAVLAGLSRGDTVWLASGTYDEVVNFTKLPGTGTTTIRALPGATPVIDGTSGSAAAGFVLQTTVADVTFQDLTIQNASSGALGIQFYYADGGKVIDCVTKNMSSNAVTFYYSSQGLVSGCTLQGNVAGRKTTGTVVQNNEVYGSGAEGIGLYNGSTGCSISHNIVHDNYSVNIYLDSISHSTIDGNLVYETDPGNDLEGIEFSDEHYDDLAAPVNSYNTVINNVIVGHNLGIVFWLSGLWPTDALNQQSGLRYDVIANNTLVNNKGSMKWDASAAHVGTTIQNNLIVAAAGISAVYLLQAKSANGVSLDHNLWFAPDLPQPFLWLQGQSDHAGFVSASGQGKGDVVGDPLLAGTWAALPATNLELTKSSPAIGAGVLLAAVPDDFLGAARPSSGGYDLGAFQYGAMTPPDGGVGPGPDAGTTDAGHPGESDGGGGSGGADAGTSPGKPASGSGCSCSTAGDGAREAGAAELAGLVVALLVASRRRRARSQRLTLVGPLSLALPAPQPRTCPSPR
jgi:MYXO-CTERM domain-containing protein